MDFMDIDEVWEVPDTPERLAGQNKNERRFSRNSSVVKCTDNTDICNNALRHGLKNRIKVDEQGKRLPFCPPRSSRNAKNSEIQGTTRVSVSDNSSSSNSSLLSKRMGGDMKASYEGKHLVSSKISEKGRPLCSNPSTVGKPCAIIDITEQNGHSQELREAFRQEKLKCQAQDMREGVISISSFSSNGVGNSSKTINTGKGKEQMDDTCKFESNLVCGKNINLVDSQQRTPKRTSSTQNSPASNRVMNQKRLVRNGCISPHNIAKAKQFAENHNNCPVDAQNNTMILESTSQTEINCLIAEDRKSQLAKGKAVLTHPHALKNSSSESRKSLSRNSKNHNGKFDTSTDANKDMFMCSNGLDGWRSTHSHSNKVPDEVLNFPGRNNDLRIVNQKEHYATRRDSRSSEWVCGNYPRRRETVSHLHDSSSSVGQTSSSNTCQFGGRINGFQHLADTFSKRQKHGLRGNHGQCSTSATDDADVLFLGSFGGSSQATSTENHESHDQGKMHSVVEIDELSPKARNDGCHVLSSSTKNESDDPARQVEADEMLALELQEQLYNESLGIEGDEIDAHIALALQQEESRESFSLGHHNVFHPRGPTASNLRSRTPSIRRGGQTRLVRRMEQMRSRFQGQSPRAPRERNSLFHPNVDVDMRIHLLEALEALSEMGMASQIVHEQRDFNENDYEMLLALDEHNHHVGASTNQINSLPQSTVQSQNYEESCAICLETPTLGDIIRHLPCLHKFHKDCIDPWLRRKTSCPVCKSSIT